VYQVFLIFIISLKVWKNPTTRQKISMESYRGLVEQIPRNSVVTVGSFDGMHLGHRRIISFMGRLARQINGTSCLITFDPHPRKLIYHDSLVHCLASITEKTKQLTALGLDKMFLLRFSKELSQMTAEEFFQKIIMDHFRPVHFVMGYDHAFGKARKGDFGFMEAKSLRYGFGLSRVTPKVVGGKPASSSRIRYAIRVGELDEAHKLLGRRYSFRGTVGRGQARGKELGFPTANIELDDPDKILPPDGVYEIMIYRPKTEKIHRGLLNIGNNPTFENAQRSVEAYILDFHEEIYGEHLECHFISFVRAEIKFPSVKELVDQIKKDVELVQKKSGIHFEPLRDSIIREFREGEVFK
jgi:riboflavin kinase/FMN adenylyltransferase